MTQAAPMLTGLLSSPIEEGASVCQLHLGRLVHQCSAIAGWLSYHHDLLKQRQYLKTVLPTAKAFQITELDQFESEDFLHHLTLHSTEIQPDIWEFHYTPAASPQMTVQGLKFRDSLSAQWAYLALWNDPLTTPLKAQPLWTELESLKSSILLDQQHAYHRLQAEHYQKILQRIEHQIRNPLAIIHLYAANLQSSLQQEPDRLQAGAICEAVHHLSDHLTEMIAGCQRTQVRAEDCPIPALWAEVWQGLQLSAQTQRVRLVLPSQPLHILGDRAQLLQAFENLLHNALCFSPSGGEIRVQWQEFHQEVLITIADQGPGLSRDDLQHMFRPYYSHRPQGSGLGLTIARQIVAYHGGQLWADNLPDGGAQFSMVLPRQPPTP